MESKNFPDVILRPGGGRRCRVVYSYAPQNEDELRLEVNDEIEYMGEVEEGWWRGKVKGSVGVFPSNFVVDVPTAEEPSLTDADLPAQISTPDEQVPILPPKPIKEQCRVLFPYEAAVEDELTLKKDDIVTIITKDVEDKGWWKGELRGKIGLFPDNFVELIPQPELATTPSVKKPDRPAKVLPDHTKVDSKIPLITASVGPKKTDTEAKNNAHNEVAAKRKSGDLSLIKPDTVASHRKSLEEKAAIENNGPFPAGGKSPLRPPVSGKPKPAAAAKPASVKRLSANDLVDGGISSKISNSRGKSIDGEPEELDLDSVERSDMLSHITASRPRAPGRRPPSGGSPNIIAVNNNENERTIETPPLTNGNADNTEVEKSTKENKYEKHKPPFMEELKVNLKSSKPSTEIKLERKSTNPLFPWANKISSQSSLDTSSSTFSVSNNTSSSSHEATAKSSEVRQSVTSSAASHRTESMHSKISELSSVFSEKSKSMHSVGGAVSPEITQQDGGQKKEVQELRNRVDRLEKTVSELVFQLREEADKRRMLESELNKLTDLVTQV